GADGALVDGHARVVAIELDVLVRGVRGRHRAGAVVNRGHAVVGGHEFHVAPAAHHVDGVVTALGLDGVAEHAHHGTRRIGGEGLHAALHVDEIAPGPPLVRPPFVVEALLARLHPHARHLRHGLAASRVHPLHEAARRLADEIAHVEPDGAALRNHRLRDTAADHAHV